jgi:hypothetical protein
VLQVLPTASNLFRWKRTLDPSCPLCACGKSQTNKRVLSNCSSATALHRYTNRHNEVLSVIAWLRSSIAANQQLYADLPESDVSPVCDLFNNCRPDIVVCNSNSIHALELSVCHETNLLSSRSYKNEKYRSLAQRGSTRAANRRISSHTIEVSTLGFISNVFGFTKAINIPNMPDTIKHKIVTTVLMSSFTVYCNRNKQANSSV